MQWSNTETMNYLEPVVHRVTDRCLFLSSLKKKINPTASQWIPCVTPGYLRELYEKLQGWTFPTATNWEYPCWLTSQRKGEKICMAQTEMAWSNLWSVLLTVFYIQATAAFG